jgi:hypothetical protein
MLDEAPFTTDSNETMVRRRCRCRQNERERQQTGEHCKNDSQPFQMDKLVFHFTAPLVDL